MVKIIGDLLFMFSYANFWEYMFRSNLSICRKNFREEHQENILSLSK